MYASARRIFARLASEIFLSSLQSGFFSNLLGKKKLANSKQFQMTQRESMKSEARSSKQIQMTKNTRVQTKLIRIPRFGIARVLTYWAAVCFGFRYSNFGFCFGLFLGAINLGEVVLLNS